jgi:ATP/maltotriose-dependent transcriptional regulator MalT
MHSGQPLEREAVLAAITRLLDRVRTGRGGALFVLGEAGLGKTTSLSQAMVLGAPTMRVGLGCGDVMETSLPFSVFTAALDAVGYHDPLVVPSAGAGFDDVRAAHFHGVLSWLQHAAGPVLLALDDLHWSDPDSLALLSFICRRLSGLPVAVLATLRPWPPAAHELARALVHNGYASVQRLAPLSDDAVAAVLADRLGYPVTEAMSRAAVTLCAGNPSLLDEVAMSISQQGKADGSIDAKTVGVDGIALARFVGLPPGALRLAQAASVLGTRFRPSLATAVADLGEQQAEMALVALCRSGLVRQDTETTATFVYPLLCQSLYHEMAAPLRARLHARAFSALTMRGLEVESVEHALRADLTGDPAAIMVLERAGRAALATGALAPAIENLQAAVRLAGDRAMPALQLVLGEALLIGGRPGEAIGVYEHLHKQAVTDPIDRVQTLRMWGRALFMTAAHEQAVQRFTEAAALAGTCDDTAVAEVLIDDALTSWLTLGPTYSLPLAKRAYELAATVPEPVRRKATGAWGFVAFLNGDPAGLAASKAAAGELLSGRIDLSERCWALGPVGTFAVAALFAERFGDVEQALTITLAAAERAGATEVTVAQLVTKAVLEMRQGRLTDAFKVADQATELVELAPYCEGLAGAVKAEILLLMGRLAECEQWCQRIETIATSRGQLYALLQLWHVRAQLLHHAGDFTGACVHYSRIEQLTARMGIAEPCAVPWARHALVTYVASDRLKDASRLIAWLERAAQRLPCRWPRIAVSAGRAMLAEANDAPDTAARHYQTALALHNRVELPVEYIETMLGYGAFLRRCRQPAQGRRHLATALEIAEQCGAGWLTDRVREEFAIAGGRRRRARDEPARLTAQEQRVARLAAAGHSNKNIAAQLTVSVKTIEFHLAKVYTKLGINSRHELTTGQRPPDPAL